MERLTIITPCSRPDNLPYARASIEAGWPWFDIDWRVVFDTSTCTPVFVDGAIIAGLSVAGSRFGNAQRNYALDRTDGGWVYFLDDDNLMHPGFFAKLHEVIKNNPDLQAFAFAQDLGVAARKVAPEFMHMGMIDMGQVCIQRDLIGDIRFQLHPYEADGYFIEDVYRAKPGAWGFVNEVVTFYNGLRR